MKPLLDLRGRTLPEALSFLEKLGPFREPATFIPRLLFPRRAPQYVDVIGVWIDLADTNLWFVQNNGKQRLVRGEDLYGFFLSDGSIVWGLADTAQLKLCRYV